KIAALHGTITCLQNCTLEGNQNMVFGRVQIYMIIQGLIREEVSIKVKGKIHKVSIVEEVRDITCWNIQELVFSKCIYKIGNVEGEKVGKNDMRIDEDEREEDGDSNGEWGNLVTRKRMMLSTTRTKMIWVVKRMRDLCWT
nr:transposon TX1 [Tanacetum cinerariifolium]